MVLAVTVVEAALAEPLEEEQAITQVVTTKKAWKKVAVEEN